MTVYGDTDPEDGWVPSDPLAERLERLERWVESVVLEHTATGPTPRARVRTGDAADEVDRMSLEDLTPAQLARLAVLRATLGPLPK